MTLPLRRKHPITALNSLRANPTRKAVKLLSRIAFAAAISSIAHCCSSSTAFSQQWQPNRTNEAQEQIQHNELRPSSQNAAASRDRNLDHAPRPVLSSTEQVGSGVVLRWQTTAPRSSSSNQAIATQRTAASVGSNSVQPASYSTPNHVQSAVQGPENPLRYTVSNGNNSVRQAAYQQERTNLNTSSNPSWRSANARLAQEESAPAAGVPDLNGLQTPALPELLRQSESFSPDAIKPFGPGNLQDAVPSLDVPSIDPLDQPEMAPIPPTTDGNSKGGEVPRFPPQIQSEKSPTDQPRELIDPPNPLDGNKKKADDKDSDEDSDDLEDLLQRARKAATPNCISQREQLRGKPLTSIKLDAAPVLAAGLSSNRSAKEAEAARKSFEQKSMFRDWTDFRGNTIGSGRMIDMRIGNVVIENGGTHQLIPLSSLSDVDMGYVAELWNLPFRCGTGFEPLEGRNFIASTVQWKASGACHNPLYFEQVQLERYGHEIGPVLQPLVSSAHFFLTIPMLPYKMGINPPNECQYALGYYRPGNCAPYMIQPFPWSLRGGLAEAAAIVGGAAVIP